MQVCRLTSFAELSSQAAAWNCLTRGVPFRSWEWQSTWWEHYGQGKELFLVTVSDDQNNLIGVAPWFAEHSALRGRTLQFLGGGEICSDYLSILTTVEHEDSVVTALAEWLLTANSTGTDQPASNTESSGTIANSNTWDLLQLSAVSTDDCAVAKLVAHLVEAGSTVHRREEMNCWRIVLPKSWDEYEALLSKSHRKQVRRIKTRALESGRAVLRTVCTLDELTTGMKILVDLHQKRRIALGEPGCFASPAFAAFLPAVAAKLLSLDRLRLHWIELDGRPVAAEFHLLGNDVTYAYQAGVDPEMIDDEPGRIINIATLMQAVTEGQREFDFLRGDEPYKAHWRAEPRPQLELRVVAKRGLAQVRHGVWLAGDTMKNWLKSSFHLSGMH